MVCLLLSLLLLHMEFNQAAATTQYPIHNLTTGLNYPTIQTAINANETKSGDTISIDEGIYFENVEVNKSVSLIGENRDMTIIQPISNDFQSIVFLINRTDGVVIEGFTIQNCGFGVFLLDSNYCRIANIRIFNCSQMGVWIYGSHDDFVDNNYFNSNYWGVYIVGEQEIEVNNIVFSNVFDNNSMGAIGIYYNCENNSVISNLITGNSIGIDILTYASNNLIVANVLQNNGKGVSFYLSYSDYETFYHNNFINNSINVDNNPKHNKWDNGYPSGGNYWSDYNGTDSKSGPYQNLTGSDGIGDTPYINTNYEDSYPLIAPYLTSQNMSIEIMNLYYQIFKVGSDLNAENQNLTSAYTTLLSNYGNLQETSSDLNITDSNLNATYLATLTQLDNTKNELYIFASTTVILALVATLLAVRRRKETQTRT